MTEGGKARYKVEVTKADAYGYSAIATAVVDFDKDGVFNVWIIDQEGNPGQKVMD